MYLFQASQEHLIAHVLPMLVRAYDDTDARMQEEVLKKTVSLAKQLDAQVIVTVLYLYIFETLVDQTWHSHYLSLLTVVLLLYVYAHV